MSAQNMYKVTEDFEAKLCEYTGAKYAIAVDSCSSALLLSLMYEGVKGKTISIPSRTYMSVPCCIIQAGGIVDFKPVEGTTLKGMYNLGSTKIWDSALRFTHNMYIPNTLMCLSFSGAYKHLKLGKGGCVLTDDENAAKWIKKARFSGRNEVSYHIDTFDQLGFNCYILPEISARALILMLQFWNVDGTPKSNDDLELPYPDLSKFPIYTKPI